MAEYYIINDPGQRFPYLHLLKEFMNQLKPTSREFIDKHPLANDNRYSKYVFVSIYKKIDEASSSQFRVVLLYNIAEDYTLFIGKKAISRLYPSRKKEHLKRIFKVSE